MIATDPEVRSNYNEAFTLLKENTPEQRLDVQLPYETFLQLDQAFYELKSAEGISEDQRYPSLGYNSLTQTVTVVTCPSNIHEGAAGWIEYNIFTYIDNYLSTRSPHIRRNISMSRSTTQSFSFVGTIETYDKLLDDKDMWINGKGVNVVILVCFKESPRFRNPVTRYTDIAGVDAEKEAMAQSLAETVEANIARGYYGPHEYHTCREPTSPDLIYESLSQYGISSVFHVQAI
ncbi:hypothetical protein POJ06DRAFT_234831 [Lipomyces tetrasporus]|uniref:Uncharacterized protein n=1 Tax=Lipomyces tetrasporus TaxID=54092 RepID=A0AAD7R145_9ASCO|nr:uncharacterized protein POJ06DRAFT_234831 [Lipomyces tetrasporus]KAJ8103847.1 hypothetical protein POJ06DRAFT_234831 [Lipomyces tetrasporus]